MMRVVNTNGGLKVHAIAGTYVVLLGFNLAEVDCVDLLGFSIHRLDHTENEAYYLSGMKAFTETDPGFPAGSLYSTRDHPIQSFQWANYSAKPGHDYTYTITALKGAPANLTPHAQTVIDITTESPESGAHDIYFNRGLAASQAYVRRFGDRAPEEVTNRKAFEWLSRGLNEALEDFIRSSVPGQHALRIAAYEFNYAEFLDMVKEVLDTGVDIQIIYDARQDNPKISNRQAVAAAGLDQVSFERTQPKSYISHNKFIVKLEDGQPKSVWTGGTNFSEGGIYGHSNVAHVVEEEAIASNFLNYWTALLQDPTSKPLKNSVETISPLPAGPPPEGTTVLFSPRKNLAALDWYADLALNASDGLLMTFAFGMNDIFKNVYENGLAPFRLALMEKKTRPMKPGPARDAEEGKIQVLRNMPENVFAIGSFIRTNEIDGWVKEKLTNLNSHVRYVHNKFMLIDPLTDDPIVIAGSANFSDASTRRNDENMVVTRGNQRVADIYLGEFMRLYSHHAFRESLQWRDPGDPPKPLKTDDWWRDYFGQTPRSTRRKFFARVQV
ncbi:MAG: phospholipase D-like domain-containing protein [Chloroflexota bacterium]|nr:phospholipase D-like domain-containing protein [Chloroflexota bacterium]